jgi:hypothetical protein
MKIAAARRTSPITAKDHQESDDDLTVKWPTLRVPIVRYFEKAREFQVSQVSHHRMPSVGTSPFLQGSSSCDRGDHSQAQMQMASAEGCIGASRDQNHPDGGSRCTCSS